MVDSEGWLCKFDDNGDSCLEQVAEGEMAYCINTGRRPPQGAFKDPYVIDAVID